MHSLLTGQMGFNRVNKHGRGSTTVKHNLEKAEMMEAIQEFCERVAEGDDVLFLRLKADLNILPRLVH